MRKPALLLSLALGVLLATAVGAAISRAGPPAPVRTRLSRHSLRAGSTTGAAAVEAGA